MFDKMKQLMEMKKQAEQMKRDLEGLVIEHTQVEGVTVTVDGAQNLKSLRLDEQLWRSWDKSQAEEKLLKAVNGAIRQSQTAAARKMKESAGMNFPGF